jgi:hypothetical protein
MRLISILLIGGCSPVFAQEGEPTIRGAGAPSEITGVIQVRGCKPDASAIDLRAQPVQLRSPRIRNIAIDPRATDVRARVEKTPNPHAFRFLIQGLRPVTPYHLAIFVPSDTGCAKVFWRSRSNGFVVSGGPSVLIEGIAATTRIEVLQPETQSWVGADHLDFTDPSVATRRFRWRTSVPGAVGGELQISTTAFPNSGNFAACDEPPAGVVYRQLLPIAGDDWVAIPPIPFQRILTPGVLAGAAAGTRTDEATYRMLLVGAPAYVRVVPITADGPACATEEQGVPGWVIVAKLPGGGPDIPEPAPAPPILQPGAGHHYRPPYFYTGGDDVLHPTYDEFAYRAINEHTLPTAEMCNWQTNWDAYKQGVPVANLPAFSDHLACYLVLSGDLPGGQTVHVGEWFIYQMVFSGGGGSSPLDVAVSLVTGTLNAAGVAVTTIADLYNSSVAAVKLLAYDALLTLPLVGQFCDQHADDCRQAISIGMTYGMYTMGLPPSVPNWDELKQEGTEYLGREIGQELEARTGIPSPLTEAALNQLAQAIVAQMSQNRSAGISDPAYKWLARYYGFTPASWTAVVKKNGSEPLPNVMMLRSTQTPLFLGADVPLPQRFALPAIGETSRDLQVPIVLRPNLADIPAPHCVSSAKLNPRRQCKPMFLATEPFCEYELAVGANGVWETDENCEKLADMVQVYYRDAWVTSKAQAVPCTIVSAVTAAAIGPLYLPIPGLTMFLGAGVRPLMPLIWSDATANGCQ